MASGLIHLQNGLFIFILGGFGGNEESKSVGAKQHWKKHTRSLTSLLKTNLSAVQLMSNIINIHHLLLSAGQRWRVQWPPFPQTSQRHHISAGDQLWRPGPPRPRARGSSRRQGRPRRGRQQDGTRGRTVRKGNNKSCCRCQQQRFSVPHKRFSSRTVNRL